MVDILEQSKNELLKELVGTIPQMKEAGIGSVVNTEKLRQINVDLSLHSYLEEGSKVYTDEERYYIVSPANEVLYYGNIDEADGDETVSKDLEEFPHLTEVTILLGKGDIAAVDELLSNPMYFVVYSSEMMNGLMKSHKNGHIDIEAELKKALS